MNLGRAMLPEAHNLVFFRRKFRVTKHPPGGSGSPGIWLLRRTGTAFSVLYSHTNKTTPHSHKFHAWSRRYLGLCPSCPLQVAPPARTSRTSRPSSRSQPPSLSVIRPRCCLAHSVRAPQRALPTADFPRRSTISHYENHPPATRRATPAPHAPALAFSSPFPLSALPALGGTSARPRSLCVSGVRAMSARGGNSEGASRKGGAQKPSKICVTCQRPFEWRKKWERCWDEVTTCSKRCNAERRLDNKAAGGSDKTTGGSKDAASGDDDDDEDNALINSEFRNCDDRASSSGSSDDARAEDKKTEDRKALKKAAKLQKREKREGRALTPKP